MFRNFCLHWAASFGSTDTISLLLDRGAQVNHPDGIREGNLCKVSSSCTMNNWFNFFRKGTIVVIPSDPLFKEGNARFTTVPLKFTSDEE